MLPKSLSKRSSSNSEFQMYPSKDFNYFEEDINNEEYINTELNKLNLEIEKIIEQNNYSDTLDISREKDCCIYYGVNNLETELNKINFSNEISNINICAYHINESGYKPFIQYFLYKKPGENDFSFPCFPYLNKMDIMSKSLTIIEVLYMSYFKKSEYSYKGFKVIGNDVYIFFDCSKMNIESARMNKNNDLWLVLIDEIVNKGYVCNYGIKKEVMDFFVENTDFLYLKDLDTDDYYETPSVVYSSCKEKMIHFTSVFGVSPDNNEMK